MNRQNGPIYSFFFKLFFLHGFVKITSLHCLHRLCTTWAQHSHQGQTSLQCWGQCPNPTSTKEGVYLAIQEWGTARVSWKGKLPRPTLTKCTSDKMCWRDWRTPGRGLDGSWRDLTEFDGVWRSLTEYDGTARRYLTEFDGVWRDFILVTFCNVFSFWRSLTGFYFGNVLQCVFYSILTEFAGASNRK